MGQRDRPHGRGQYLTSEAYELKVAVERIPAKLHLAPLYDPKNERVRS